MIYHQDMKEPSTNNRQRQAGVELALRKCAMFTVGLAITLLDILRELFTSTEVRHDAERRLHDSDFSGEINHRTGRMDAGTDPYGWYDD